MLEYLRKASDKLVAKILMGVLIFSFVGWGVASWVFGESRIDDSVLRVGGASLKIQAFENEKSRALNAMEREEQKQIYSDKTSRTRFSEQILSRLTRQLMLEQRARDLGLSVSGGQVARIIRTDPVFQTDGKFDIARFNSALYYAQITEDQLADSIRANALREMVLTGVSASAPAPKFMTEAMYKSRRASREIEFASIKFADFKAPGDPTDDQLRETYAKNPKQIPEFRKISYVLVPAKIEQPDSFEAGYKTAQKLEDALIGGEAMQTAAARLGAKFAALPAMSASMKTEGGKSAADSVFGAQLAAQAFEMEQGIESQILETKSGFAILRVDEIMPQHNAPFESMRKELAEQWRADEQKKQAYEKANELLIGLNGAGMLNGGKSASVGRATGAPLEVLAAAFANPVGTKTIVPGAGAFYVLNVKSAALPAADAAKQAALGREAAEMLNRALADDYIAFLMREYPVKINQRVYKRLFGE